MSLADFGLRTVATMRARGLLKRRKDRGAFDGKRRDGAGEDGAQKHKAKRKTYDDGVDVNGFDAANVRAQGDEPSNCYICEGETDGSAENREKRGLGEMLAEQAPPAAA